MKERNLEYRDHNITQQADGTWAVREQGAFNRRSEGPSLYTSKNLEACINAIDEVVDETEAQEEALASGGAQ